MLGTRALLGRTLAPDDERGGGAAHVAVISHALWMRRFGGDSAVIGRALPLGDVDKGGASTLRVIGVMPGGFYFPDHATEFWRPSTLYWRWEREHSERFSGYARRWGTVARLAPRASVASARAELAGIGRRLAQSYVPNVPDFPGFGVRVVPILEQVTGPELPRALWLLMGAVGFVLLTACANVANLLLARGATRERELSIRAAVGAGRGRLLRQLLAECLVLALGAGLTGVALAWVLVRLIPSLPLAGVPRLAEVRVDGWVVAFAAGATLAAALACGLLPAWKVSRRDPADALRNRAATGGHSLRRTRALLVAAECALVVVLLSGAGLLLRSFVNLRAVPLGFDPERALVVRVALPLPEPGRRYSGAEGVRAQQRAMLRREALLQEVVDRVRAIPGVRRAGFIDDLLVRGQADEAILVPGRGADSLPNDRLAVTAVSPDLLPALGVPLVRGRMLERADAATKVRLLWAAAPAASLPPAEQARVAGAEPVVVNETFARRYFPGEDPLGRRFYIGPAERRFWYEVVGVVGDTHREGLERAPIPEYYVSFIARASAELVVRTAGDPLGVAPSVRAVIKSSERAAQILEVTTVDRRLGALSAQRRFQTMLLAAFAAVALRGALRGRAAHARDRRQARIRREPRRGAASRCPRGDAHAAPRPNDRARGRSGGDAAHVAAAVRREHARPGDVRRRNGGARRHGARRVSGAGAPGGAGGSGDSAARGLSGADREQRGHEERPRRSEEG